MPSSFCGLFGLKPTYGRLSRARTFPFVASLDHLGPLARSTRDLALAYDAMQGHDPEDPVCADRPAEPALPASMRGIGGLRIAVAGGYFKRGASPEALDAVARVAKALGATREIEIPEAARARAAAFVITTSEGAALHLDRLRTRAARFRSGRARPPDLPAPWCPLRSWSKAQKFRRWYRDAGAASCSKSVDAILAPATPFPAPRIGQQTMLLDGAEVPLRPNIGIFTQPISFIGLPVVAVPVPLRAAADRRADHRRALARGRGAAHRPRAGKRRRCRGAAAGRIGRIVMEIDLPEVVAEVRAAFERYETGARLQRHRDARHPVPPGSAHHPLRHRREPLRPRGGGGVPRRALARSI